jgi:hypothetical protein
MVMNYRIAWRKVRLNRVARVLYLVLYAGLSIVWVLSYIVPASAVVAIDGNLIKLSSIRGHLMIDNTPEIQILQRLAALHTKEMEQLNSLYWNDFEPRWQAVHFDGAVSGPSPTGLRDEQHGVLLEEAAISARQRYLRSAPIPIGALRSRNMPYWGLVLGIAFPLLVAFAFRKVRGRMAAVYVPPLCKVCGYDLRATPERCPECGAPAERPDGGSAPAKTLTSRQQEVFPCTPLDNANWSLLIPEKGESNGTGVAD